jgi:hypothetical protein
MLAGDVELTEKISISRQFKEQVVQPILKVGIEISDVSIIWLPLPPVSDKIRLWFTDNMLFSCSVDPGYLFVSDHD